MLVMIGCSEYRKGKVELADESLPFIPFLSTRDIELIIEIGHVNVQLIRANAHDGPVFFVQLFDLKCILAVPYRIIVEFVPNELTKKVLGNFGSDSYQNDMTANLGPGNFAIGLRYKR